MKPSHNILSFGINGSLRKKEHLTHNNPVEYYLFNSAANLKAYSYEALDFAYYGYNASNTRTYKLSMLNTNQWVNGQPQPIQLQMQQAMFYPNAYINFNQNGEYTKHYYNGSERSASRLGDVNLSISFDYDDMLETHRAQIEERFRVDMQALFNEEVPVDNPPMLDVSSLQPTGTPNDIFYYHMNHLGSTAFVTDQNQNITQGFLYAPFGEITTEYNANFYSNVLPKYSFNAKELDEETGMYYYEARYYKPPVFTSRDPMFEKYFWTTPYAYCANNPVKYVDPSGCDIIPTLSFKNSKYRNIYNNLSTINTYRKLIEPFDQNNIDLYLDVPNELDEKILGQTYYKYSKILRDENGKIAGMSVQTDYGENQNEIGCVKTLLHEAIHANRKYNEIDDPQSHTGFDRQSVLEGLKQYNEKFLGSKYTDEQLEIISWGGLCESDEFKTYINNKYKKTNETCENAVIRFKNELKSLIHDN